MTTRELLLSAYASGDLQRLVLERPTQASLAAALGMTLKMYRSGHERLVRSGELPSWTVMRGAAAHVPEVGAQDSQAPTEKWPSLAAFDAELTAPVVPRGHILKGVSSLIDGETGAVKQQWVKTQTDDEGYDLVEVIRLAFGDGGLPRCAPVPPPTRSMADLLACYQLGDPHVGLRAWRRDSGDDWDLDIAERTLFGAADKLVSLSPSCERALVVNIGDFFHADNGDSTTTRGTRVDVDGRWSKVLAVGIRLMRRIIDRALEKHQHVTVINEIGNHDTNSSVVLAACLGQFYERDPRVVVDTSPAHFHWYRFGKYLFGTHHGHGPKLDKLPGIMAHDRAQDWGETLYRHWITGHIHHKTFHEFPGCTVRSLGTMAPGDAWHNGEGYRSGREMICEVYDRNEGLLTCNTVGFHQLAA